MDDIIYGRHTVLEALRAGRAFNRILIAGDPHTSPLADLIDAARQRGIPYQLTDRRRLDAVCRAPHQGVVAFVAAHAYASLEDILNRAGPSPPLLLVLDGIEDPHNLGALLRTSAAVGVDGVLLPKRRAVGLTGAVAKASAGAVERIPVAQVPNIASALQTLKENGVWTVGLCPDFPRDFTEVDYRLPTALVIGGEGRGLRPIVQRSCDHLVRIPMAPGSESLNASVAAALVLYEAFRQRGWS
ncbi:MAG: 23S rRNA (guanosine(2251)-2'-O)-methyltransferase RlmB [Candidatus Latescibacteria bacterium]|nr:23S rRNA (guanosine(2251)-2'-O)-methyltransferase RlmB [Candidatus Latescibacterota bacterium]